MQALEGDRFFQYLKDTFDVLWEEGATQPKMMSVGLHCRIVGRPGRALGLARFLDYVKSKEKVRRVHVFVGVEGFRRAFPVVEDSVFAQKDSADDDPPYATAWFLFYLQCLDRCFTLPTACYSSSCNV